MEYHGNFGHTLGRIQKIALIIRIQICYTYCCLATHNVEPTLPGFQGLKTFIQYLASKYHNPYFILPILMMDQM